MSARGDKQGMERARIKRFAADECEAPKPVDTSETDNWLTKLGKATLTGLLGLDFSPYPTRYFKQLVIAKDPDEHSDHSPDTDTILEEKCSHRFGELPDDIIERQKMLLLYYTAESPIYPEMNKALRGDDPVGMAYYGAFIHELRDVFETGVAHRVVTPFLGKVWRGITLPDIEHELETTYLPDKSFVWPAFTSTSTNPGVANNFGGWGNAVVFEITCNPPVGGSFDDDDCEFAPADIAPLSVFGASEAEVLFPPNVEIRVINVQRPTATNGLSIPIIICETCGYDSIWGLIDAGNYDEVHEWLNAHPDAKPDGVVHNYAHRACDAGNHELAQSLVDRGYSNGDDECPETGYTVREKIRASQRDLR